MTYHSSHPLPRAPKRADIVKVRAALYSDIMRVERWLEVCPEEDRPKAQKNLECLKKVLGGTYQLVSVRRGQARGDRPGGERERGGISGS